ncbi:MAG: DUF2853 family protein [Saprospiraceae bacterium]
MATLAEKLEKYKATATAQLNAAGVTDIDAALLDKYVTRMKNMIDNRDATLVSTTDPAELETVRKNFVVKTLEVADKDKGAAAVNAVAEKMKGERNKNRAAYYYLVQKELGM